MNNNEYGYKYKEVTQLLIVLVLFTPIFLYFKGIRLQVFAGTTDGEILVAIIFGVILALSSIAKFHPQFKFLRKPLWGFKETPEGYKDVSLEKHPYVVAIIILIIVIAVAYAIL